MTDKKIQALNQAPNPSSISRDDIINSYLRVGSALINLRGKIPVLKNWTEAQFSPEQTPSNFPGNYGVVLQEDDLVVDYDPRNDKTEGKRAYQNLINYLGIALDTYTVRTGSGGLHVYLKKPKNVLIKETLSGEDYPEFSGLEFKTVGRQVVCPPSIHPQTNKQYEISYKMPDDKRMEAPEKLLELLHRESSIPGIDLDGEGLGAFTDDNQTVSRFVEFLNNAIPAIEGSGGDLQTYKTACRGRDFNLSPSKTFELMLKYYNPRCIPAWEDKDLWAKVRSAYINNSDIQGKWNPQSDFGLEDIPEEIRRAPVFQRDKNGMPKKMLCNVISFMMLEDNPLYDCLRFNLFTNSIEFKKPAPWHNYEKVGWTDEDAIQYKAWLSDEKSFEINTPIIHEAALTVASRNSYHPIKNYIESLEWDGKERIGNWLSEYCDTQETDYSKAIGQKVLLAALARLYNPGTKFDHVLVIEGDQGIGKSTLVSILGKYWYGDIIIDPNNKDTVDALRGKWVIEISEMECAKREINALKRFITCTSDRVRPAYARTTQDFPRQCIFIGTINPETGKGYLKDQTGNRRYWPIKVNSIDFIRLREDIDQIWAEAYAIYKSGRVSLYLDTKELQDYATQQVSARREEDPWEEIIANYIADTGLDKATTQQIATDCLFIPIARIDKLVKLRIGTALGLLGFEPGIARFDGGVRRCYVKKKNVSVCRRESAMDI